MKKLILGCTAALLTSGAFAQTLPLQSTPIMQYQCIVNKFQPIIGYFLQRNPPSPIPYSTDPLIVCHDVAAYGQRDDVMFPRLNEKLATFKAWSDTNPMFYDNDGDGVIDVNNFISREARNLGLNVPTKTVFFNMLISKGTRLGYVMPPFIDQTTFRSYCLSSQHYNSATPLLKVLGMVLGNDTEGLYLGERTKGDRDFVFISESVLKKSWFHITNNVPTIPNDRTAMNQPVYVIYEGDVFQIKGLNEISPSRPVFANIPTGTNYPTHDRKIGCVPKN
jgi:hypothetical protein